MEGLPMRQRRFWPVALLMTLSLLVSACGAQEAASKPQPTATSTPKITLQPTLTGVVDRASIVVKANMVLGDAVPAYFTGFSIEASSLCEFLSAEQKNSAIDRLYHNFAPLIIRIGGNTMETSVWKPNAPCSGVTFGNSTIQAVFAFAHRVDAKIIWGLNLSADNPSAAADEASVVVADGGSALAGLEIGNEPNDWTTESQYEASWQAYVAAIKRRTGFDGFVGPSMYDYEGQSWFNHTIQRERDSLSLVTYHYYPMQYNATTSPQRPTVNNLLSRALMAQTAVDLKRVVTVAHANGLSLVIDETNSSNGGGARGVSDSVASALWMADYLFTAEENGVTAVNVHGGGATSGPDYAPLKIQGRNGSLIVAPIYYGMYLFHMATGDGATTPIGAAVASSANITAHAVRDRNGVIQLALINKDTSANVDAEVRLQGVSKRYHVTQVTRLAGPSLWSTAGVTLDGLPFAPNGSWRAPMTTENIPMSGSSLTISVPKTSAILVTLAPNP